ncbi:MAG: hypothetical protein LC659_03935, partial [Myxococcales bacterium]|nr:hypothetical protein [Myxococcales bacterium]
LDRERDRIETELKDKETALAQFLAKHPEFARETAQPGQNQAGASIRAASAANAARANAPRGDSTLASLEREAARLQERLGMPVTHKRGEVQADPQLVAAKEDAAAELKQAQKDLADKQNEFTEEHPDVRTARARVKQAQDKYKRASDAVAISMTQQQQKSSAKDEDEGYIDRGALDNQLKRINDEISEYKRRKADSSAPPPTVVASSVVALETDWVRLNREVVAVRDRFQSLQDKEFKAAMVESAAASGRTAQMVIIDPAFVPTHAAPPGRTTIMAAGLAATMVLALLFALGLALVDDRIYDRDDIERLGMLPLIGLVPRPGKDDHKVKLG